MSDDILDEIKNIFEITEDTDYEFRKLYGFTFVFKRKIISVGEKISSAEIKPAGIIYEENGQYYYAPLDKTENITEIIEKYVEMI